MKSHAWLNTNYPYLFSEIQNIIKWTKQSFRSPPYNLAVHSECSSTTRTVKMNDIYTDLKWVHIHRKPCDVVAQDIDGYWQMLVNQELDKTDKEPVRILVVGMDN